VKQKNRLSEAENGFESNFLIIYEKLNCKRIMGCLVNEYQCSQYPNLNLEKDSIHVFELLAEP